MKRTWMLSMALFAGLAACAPVGDADDEGADDSTNAEVSTYPMVSFNADGTVSQTGTLVAGSKVRVRYSASRLTECRETSGGRVQWAITGFASSNGGAAQSFDTGKLNSTGSRRSTVTALLDTPEGGDLALWFQNTDVSGCSAWDSHFGANYHFNVTGAAPAPTPTITFRANGAVDTTGTLVAGGTVTVRYEQDRLTTCRGTMSGYPQWAISGFASVNDGAAQSFETGAAASDGNRSAIDASVRLTAAGDLALWFENTNRWGCNDYDSDGGRNYHFTIRAAR